MATLQVDTALHGMKIHPTDWRGCMELATHAEGRVTSPISYMIPYACPPVYPGTKTAIRRVGAGPHNV